ncbi:MAG: DUF421 domain-containing protein [Clostridia bacterium]|nr:DUF421 domain-containing protein [Clostridia bacterium]
MQPFELVLTLIVADLATIPMADAAVPVIHGIVPAFILSVLHLLLTSLSSTSKKFANFLSGKPVIVINPKGIDCKALKNLSMSVDDVFEAIRGCGFFSVEQIQYAIMETNGKLSVLPKSEFAPATLGDMQIEVDKTAIPISLVSEGKLIEENLLVAKIEEKEVFEILDKFGVGKLKEVLLFTIDKAGKVFLQKYNQQYQTFQTKPLGKVKE